MSHSEPIKMYVNYHDGVEETTDAGSVYINWESSFISNSSSTTKSNSVTVPVGPSTGPGSVYLSACNENTSADSKSA
jgi:hypothetical protein